MIAYLIAGLQRMGPRESAAYWRVQLFFLDQRLSDLVRVVCWHGRGIQFVQPRDRGGERSTLEGWSFRDSGRDRRGPVAGRSFPSRLIGGHLDRSRCDGGWLGTVRGCRVLGE